jgi:hypothetical protein
MDCRNFVMVPMTQRDLQQTDGLIVNMVNDKLGLAQPLTENDIRISVMSVARTVPTLRFDCVVYLLHVLDRRFLGES